MKKITPLILMCLFVLTCQQNENASANTAETQQTATSETTSTNSTVEDDQPNLYFLIKPYQDDLGNPRSQIFLEVNGQEIDLQDAVACEKIEAKDYKTYQIPEAAVDACGGWWAGSGDYFYLIKNTSSNYYQVMHAEVDEQGAAEYKYDSIISLAYTKK